MEPTSVFGRVMKFKAADESSRFRGCEDFIER
jgi:hypothetical protein